MTRKEYIFKSFGLFLLIFLSAFFLVIAQFMYLGSVARVVDIAMKGSIGVVVTFNLIAIIFICKKQIRKALLLVFVANLIAFFFSAVFLTSINQEVYRKQVTAQEKGYRERLLVEYDKRVICGDVGFYTENYDWGARMISIIYPEHQAVSPKSFASYMPYKKSQCCKVSMPKSVEILGQCDEVARAEVESMLDELKRLPCPYPSIL